jgi:putative transposase
VPRVLRQIAPGCPHHITQRGNHQEKIFLCDDDRRLYLALLAEFLPRYGISLEAYCLMSNHVHLVATPRDATGLSRALQRIHSDYSRSLHLRLRQSGHLWQARFFAVALDEKHFWAAMVYVEENPVRAGLVEHAGQWPWSSAPAHLGIAQSALVNLVPWRTRFDTARWNAWLSTGPRAAALADRIREATLTGFPLGNEAFRDDLRRRLHLRTEPRKPGRPKKHQIGVQIGVRDLITGFRPNDVP